MKLLFLFTCLLLCYGMAYGQPGIITGATRLNRLYIGVPNQVGVAVEGRYCKDLRMETDNGKIMPQPGSDCTYDVVPAKTGLLYISVFDKKTGKRIGRTEYHVLNAPHPIVSIGAVGDGGNMSKEELLRQPRLIAYYECTELGLYPVTQYRITLMRNGASLFSKLYEGAAIPAELHDKFASLLAGDIILLTNVQCKDIRDQGHLVRLPAAEISVR